ncbi:MAG: hypothetical protein ABSA75_09445 [Candidatus Bathyarchaeia archaeon]|jgi:cytochrome oxidase Cu insertion factor (SCO1/SenC/PrrC family)
MPKKKNNKKIYIVTILLAILIVAAAALIYLVETANSQPTTATVGVNVGDTFTYKLTGDSILFSPDATTPAYLSEYNNTDYYQVAITGINGTLITFNTVWKFTNGTTIQNTDWINLTSGSNNGDFWAIYPSNLNVNNRLYPKETETSLTVNKTETFAYTNATRERNYWTIVNQFTNVNDPTGNTVQINYEFIYFDKQTGMLTSLTNYQEYNNPQYNIAITWQLTNSTVWVV